MSYRVRYTTQTGETGYWEGTFATRTGATHSAQARADITGYTYAVEEVLDARTAAMPDTSTTERLVALMRERHARGLAKYGVTVDRSDLTPEQWAQHAIEEMLDGAAYLMRLKDVFTPEPGSTAAHHVEILRKRVEELEAVQKVMSRDLAFALQIGDALRQAMRTGEWRAGHDQSMANSAIAGWDRWKTSLAKAPSVPVGASEAPGEGGDSDRRRLEALERYLEVDTFREVRKTSMGPFAAGTKIRQHFDAPTLAALADKLAEMEAKP